MDSAKKGGLVIICIISFMLFFNFRLVRVHDAKWDFRSYASDYVEWVRETDEDADISYKDVNIIRDKMLPNYWSTVMNPFKWTDEQISSDDKLLYDCKLHWEYAERKRNTEKETAERTFNERSISWLETKKEL